MWFLTWDAFAVSHHLNPFFSDFILHPAGINLMWNPARWTQGLLLAPVTLTLGPVFAYNVSQVAALALSAWAAYLALDALLGSRRGAFCGGLLYGFSPYMLGHAPIHSDFIFMPVPPSSCSSSTGLPSIQPPGPGSGASRSASSAPSSSLPRRRSPRRWRCLPRSAPDFSC